MTNSDTLPPSINAIYLRHGVVAQTGDNVPSLPHCCPDASACWRGTEVPSPDDTCNHLARPFIGPEYDKHRIVFLGQNLNDYGGWSAIVGLFEQVIQALGRGEKRMRFGNAPKVYRGTLVYHRVATYARILQTRSLPSDLHNSPSSLISALRGVAFLSAIKCSPHGRRSAPLNDMARRCMSRLTAPEIEALAPVTICCLYKPAFDFLRAAYPGEQALQSQGKLQGTTLGGTLPSTACLYVPHPASPGGSATHIASELSALLGHL